MNNHPSVPGTSVASTYIQELHAVASRVAVSTNDGKKIDRDEGLADALGLMEQCCRTGNKLIFIGNGGSAAIASHQAVDFWKNGGLDAIAFNDASLLTCISNDFGYHLVFAEPVKRFARRGDLLIAISSSGKSRNILEAVREARGAGCEVITFSGFEPTNPLRSLGALNFYVPSHSYGVVEVTHLMLLHALVEERMATRVEKENSR